MLAAVPGPKVPAKPEGTAEKPVQTAFRLPQELLDGLDDWVAEINKTRPWPKMTRSDLVRLVLSRAVAERPDIGGK